jgi:hypothetical protein
LYTKNKVAPIARIALLGEEEGEKLFYQDADSYLASTAVADKQTTTKVSVPALSLNKMIAAIQPDYLVMDIEGGEYAVFKIIDFQSIRKIQFELHPRLLDTEKVNFIFNSLAAAGFIQGAPFNYPNNYFFIKS